MWFLHQHWLALWLKNLVFLSPTSNHIEWDHFRQKISSWCSMLLMSAFTSLISSKNSKLFREHNSSNLCCFSFNKVFELPKATRLHSTEANLHFLILSNITTIGLPRPTSVDQASCIIVSQLKWEAHFSSNLREIIFFLLSCCAVFCVVMRTETWSEYEA